jgi:tripartite-type tricarboxylate transporter receptor subunit TctC
LRDPAVAQKLGVQGIVPRPMSPVEFRAFVDAEVKKFGEIMTRANIHAEN